MATLQLTHRIEEARTHVVGLSLEGQGPRRTAESRFDFALTPQDREDMRWYLEDYLQYPIAPAPEIARRVEGRMAELGRGLFRDVFEASMDTMKLWGAVADSLGDTRLEVASSSSLVPWELLRDPSTDGPLALRSGAFVRTHTGVARGVTTPEATERLRVLLVICRPGGRNDVAFRSVASRLLLLSREARQTFELDVLRPATFDQLSRVLEARSNPYDVVHFDGHGAFLDEAEVQAIQEGIGAVPAGAGASTYSFVSPPRPGSHGYLVFEAPATRVKQQLVDGPALGQLLAQAGVPVLVLNACRSAHAGLATEPDDAAATDAHQRVRAYGSLAQEVMDQGAAGVVAMGYNVYVVTAARFIGDVYSALLGSRPLGDAVGAARRQLAADPMRTLTLEPRALQDWVVPVVYEAAPVTLRATPEPTAGLKITLSQTEARAERSRFDPAAMAAPDVGFFGRDETLLAIDRAFDEDSVVLLHAWAGSGKTSTALEFARWFELTRGVETVLLSTFTQHLTLPHLLDRIGDAFSSDLANSNVHWGTLTDLQRRAVALQVLSQVRALWVWDNVEPVAGFPQGSPSVWTSTEQAELRQFLADLRATKAKVLLTSRRDERGWLGDIPTRVELPAMPMLECLELARAIAKKHPGVEVEDWRPLIAFTQGNPLTVTVLVGQALRDGRSTKEQLQAFVDELGAGAATVSDDVSFGRDKSLAASLDYGFDRAFSDEERNILAFLSLFQGFVEVDALCMSDNRSDPIPALSGLTREAVIDLLDRAAEVGLLSAYGGGYYNVHPAVPVHLKVLFDRYVGPAGSEAAEEAIGTWTRWTARAGSDLHNRLFTGRSDAISVLAAEEANLLRARDLARQRGWWSAVIETMQGLRALYDRRGRWVEWRRLVDELVPDLVDPTTGGPLPGRGIEWRMLTQYRVRIARQDHDLLAAEQLQRAAVSWSRAEAAQSTSILGTCELTSSQHQEIQRLCVGLEVLGAIERDLGNPACKNTLLEAIELSARNGDHYNEGVASFHLGMCYQKLSQLQNFDEAKRYYERYLSLLELSDRFGRATGLQQLGINELTRFREARENGASNEETIGILNSAWSYCQESLDLLPKDARDQLEGVHRTLGSVYREAGDMRALDHFNKAIQYAERGADTYSAGAARSLAAEFLSVFGSREDALAYAKRAVLDFEAVGPGANEQLSQTRDLVTFLTGG